MIWVTVSISIFVASLLWAFFAYSNTTKQVRMINDPMSLFVIQNLSSINPVLLTKLLTKFSRKTSALSFETVFKQQDKALICICPKWLIEYFPELQALEIEDYVTSLFPGDIQIDEYLIDKKHSQSSYRSFSQDLLNNFTLRDNEQISLQIMVKNLSSTDTDLRYLLRVLVCSPDPERLSFLTQSTASVIETSLALKPSQSNLGMEKKLHNFISRGFNRSHSTSKITTLELESLIKI